MQIMSYLHSMLDDIFIFSKYLKIPINTIEDCIINGTKISNPLRIDRKPSASFRYGKDDKLRLVDYARPEYGGDIIDIVGIIINVNVTTSKGFIKAGEHIIDNLIKNVDVFNTYKPTRIDKNSIFIEDIKSSFTFITVEYCKWNNNNFLYWYNYIRPNKELAKLLIKQLQHWNIYPILKYWLNSNIRATKIAKLNDPIYSYRLGTAAGNVLYKLYMPYSKVKFVTNASQTFNYIDSVADTKFGIIVKSIKDAVFLNVFAKYLGYNDVSFIAINSETTTISIIDFNLLINKFENILIFYDYDEAGLLNAYVNSLKYNIEPIFITNNLYNPLSIKINTIELINSKLKKDIGFTPTTNDYLNFINLYSRKTYIETKDFTDYLKRYGVNKTIKVFIVMYEAITTNYNKRQLA